jgi:hypothetical protein
MGARHREPPMNTDAVSAAMIPSRSAWRSLLWTVPFTALWTWLIYRLPVLPESGLPALTVRLMVHGLIALGLWLGLENTNLTPGQRRTAWLAIVVPFALWAGVAWTAAINGVFRTGASPLPLLPAAIFLPVIIAASATLFSIIKYIGAAYLVYLGIRAILEKAPATFVTRGPPDLAGHGIPPSDLGRGPQS